AWVLLREQDVEAGLADLAADASQSVVQSALVVQAEIPRPDTQLPRLPDEPVVLALSLSHIVRPDRVHERAGARGRGELGVLAESLSADGPTETMTDMQQRGEAGTGAPRRLTDSPMRGGRAVGVFDADACVVAGAVAGRPGRVAVADELSDLRAVDAVVGARLSGLPHAVTGVVRGTLAVADDGHVVDDDEPDPIPAR